MSERYNGYLLTELKWFEAYSHNKIVEGVLFIWEEPKGLFTLRLHTDVDKFIYFSRRNPGKPYTWKTTDAVQKFIKKHELTNWPLQLM